MQLTPAKSFLGFFFFGLGWFLQEHMHMHIIKNSNYKEKLSSKICFLLTCFPVSCPLVFPLLRQYYYNFQESLQRQSVPVPINVSIFLKIILYKRQHISCTLFPRPESNCLEIISCQRIIIKKKNGCITLTKCNLIYLNFPIDGHLSFLVFCYCKQRCNDPPFLYFFVRMQEWDNYFRTLKSFILKNYYKSGT